MRRVLENICLNYPTLLVILTDSGEEPLTLGNVTIHKLPSSDTLFFMNNICGHTALYPRILP